MMQKAGWNAGMGRSGNWSGNGNSSGNGDWSGNNNNVDNNNNNNTWSGNNNTWSGNNNTWSGNNNTWSGDGDGSGDQSQAPQVAIEGTRAKASAPKPPSQLAPAPLPPGPIANQAQEELRRTKNALLAATNKPQVLRASAIALSHNPVTQKINTERNMEAVEPLLEEDYQWYRKLGGAATAIELGDRGPGHVVAGLDSVCGLLDLTKGKNMDLTGKRTVGDDRNGVAVLFCPSNAGQQGEAAARAVANSGGRSYLISTRDHRYQEMSAHTLVAIKRTAPSHAELSRFATKRPRLEMGVSNEMGAWGMGAPQVDEAERSGLLAFEIPETESPTKDLRKALKSLGRSFALQDKNSIPTLAAAIRDRFMPSLSETTTFNEMKDCFLAAKLVAHRKALVYVVHELLTRKKGEAMDEDRQSACLRLFLLPIGDRIRGYKADERTAYCRVVSDWSKRKALPPSAMKELKDSWDAD